MSLSILLSLLWYQLLADTSPIGNADPLKDRYEEIDMMLTNGPQTFGLVTGRVYHDHFCVLENSLKKRLGYSFNNIGSACLSLEEIELDLGISLIVDMTNVELQIPHDFNFPAKAYHEALERVNRASNADPMLTWSSPKHHPSTWINTKRFDLMLQHSGNALLRPDVHTAIGGDILGGTFDLGGLLVNNRIDNTYRIHSLDYSWHLNPRRKMGSFTSFEVGSRVHDSDRRHTLNGVRLTNKPLSSRQAVFTERLMLFAAKGSILEWDASMAGLDDKVFDGSGTITLDAPLKYGMNKIRYHITEPGSLTRQNELWIRVPTKLIPSRILEYQFLFGRPDTDIDSWVSYGKIEYGLSDRITVGLHQSADVSDQNRIKNHVGADIVLRPTHTTEFQGQLNSDSGYALYAVYWNPKVATVELSDNRIKSTYRNPLRFDRRSSLVRVSLHQTKFLRSQASYLRTTYGFGSNSLLNSTLMANTHRWNIGSNIGYQWWTNYGAISMGLFRASSHVSHRLGRKHMLSTDINAIIQDRIKLESIKVSSFYNSSSLQIGANFAFHASAQSFSAGLTARINSEWLNAHMLHEATIHGHQSSQYVSTSWMKSEQSEWHAVSQTSRRSSGLVLIPFIDNNQNGVKDGNESELSGLIGKINEGRVIDSKKSHGKLMFAELQPNRDYQIVLSADLRNDPEYVVTRTRLSVDTPGVGYRVIYIPVTKSFEFTGFWKNETNLAIQPGRTSITLKKTDGDMVVQGTLFGDGTWFVDRIGYGTYEVNINDDRNYELVAVPRLLHISSDSIAAVPKITVQRKT